MTHDDTLEPSPAQLGDTMTVPSGEWTPLDDYGTQIYVYGDQPIDIAFQTADVDDEVRQLRAKVERLNARIDAAHEALAIDEFDGDSCNTLEDTIAYAVHHYRLVCDSEAQAADEIRRLKAEARR